MTQRHALIRNMTEVARSHGATVQTRVRPSETTFIADFHGISVSSFLAHSGFRAGGVLLHWHDSAQPIAGDGGSGPLGSVNLIHRRKATQFIGTGAEAVRKFADACGAITNGTAFEGSHA